MEFLAFGTLWFWALVGLFAFILFVRIAYDDLDSDDSFMSWYFIPFFGLLYFFGGETLGNSWEWIKINYSMIINYTIIYYVTGLVWSFVKWYFYLLKIRDTHKRDLANGFHNRTISEREISASYNKGKLLSWIGYWPISAVWTLINDPFMRLARWVQERFNGIYTLMSKQMFKDMNVK